MFTVEPPFNSQNDRVYAPVDNKKRYINPSHMLRYNMLLAAKLFIFLCSVISQGKVVALDR